MKTSMITTATLLTAMAGLAIAKPIKPGDDPVLAPQAAASTTQAQQADELPEQRPQAQAAPAVQATAYLGVVVKRLGANTAEKLALKPGVGLRLMTVAPDSAALKAGLEPGDVLTRLNDQMLINPQQLGELVRGHAPGDTVTLHLLREGEPMQIKATLGDRPAQAIQQAQPGQIDPDAIRQFVIPLDPFGDMQRLPGNPGEINQMIEQMRHRMQQQNEQMQRMMDQARKQMQQDRGALQPGNHANVSSTMMRNDGEHSLKLKTTGKSRHLTVKTADGELLFEGQVPEDGQIEGLVPEVQDKVDGLLNQKNFDLRFKINPQRQAPKAKPSGPVA